jgi:thioredoxin 1
VITLTDATFTERVLSAELPFVVDFWAEWCPPCGPMARNLAALTDEFAGRLLIGKINADENPATTLAYRVMSMPTLLFFERGEVVTSMVGLRPTSVLRQALTNLVTPYVNR